MTRVKLRAPIPLLFMGLGCVVGLGSVACEGSLGGGGGLALGEQGRDALSSPPSRDISGTNQDQLAAQCEALGEKIFPGPAPLRRLTSAEYDLTIEDILGDTGGESENFPPQARAIGFNGVAEAQTVTELLVEAYQGAAQNIAARVTTDLEGLMGCDPGESTCVEDFVSEFGALAYRRPLTQTEVERLLPVFEWGRDQISVAEGVAMVLEVLLQSPDYLYRPEFGAEEVSQGVVRLSSTEMATRLSYLFLGSAPDAELRQAAERDELKTKEQVSAQAERLIATERARRAFRSFHSQWLDLEAVEHIERDAAVFPGFTEETPHLLRQETEKFIEEVLFEDDGTLLTLLTARYTMANDELADFYGLEAPGTTEFQRVAVGGDRAGLLTQGSLLAHHAQPLQTSPVHRGKFIRESFLCQFPPNPPDDLIIVPPELDPDLTTRERYAAHSEDPSCAGCHELMDPLGLGFEHFDSVGRYRADENGLPIDASGEILGSDVDQPFYGPVELGSALAESSEVATCFTKQWLRFAHGRSETPDDACSLAAVGADFSESGYEIRKLVLALAQTDAFLYRTEVTP